MTNTMTLSHSNGGKRDEDYSTPQRYGKHYSTPTSTWSSARSSSYRSSSKRKLTKAEKLALTERARAAMTPPGQATSQEKMEYQTKPQRTALSVATAMKAATSPTVTSFPDSFWTPFLEQDEYDRQKMGMTPSPRQQSRDVGGREEENVTVKKLNFAGKSRMPIKPSTKPKSGPSWIGRTTRAFQTFLANCVGLTVILFLVSFLDVPYLRGFLEAAAMGGTLVMGLALWLFDVIRDQVLDKFPTLQHYLTTEFMEDIYDWIALRM